MSRSPVLVPGLAALVLALALPARRAGGDDGARPLVERVAALEALNATLRTEVALLRERVVRLELVAGLEAAGPTSGGAAGPGAAPGGPAPGTPPGPLDQARIRMAEAQMRSLGTAVQMYYLANRAPPPDLAALTRRSPRTGMIYASRIPPDPWGSAYELELLGPQTFRIRSPGPDGRRMTDDDVLWPAPR